jgi:hypothetical protein
MRTITLSVDSYIRVPLSSLLDVPLIHLMSALDKTRPGSTLFDTHMCTISGYTEWITTTTPAITIGWDWEQTIVNSAPSYVRIGNPRSNLMLLDDRERDIGYGASAELLGSLIDTLSWQEEVNEAINARYT